MSQAEETKQKTENTARGLKLEQAIRLEREAQHLKDEGKADQAFYEFDRAGSTYRQIGEPFKAAICFASAASCWDIYTGRQPLKNAATRNESAAHEAVKAGHYSYARSLFREAALLYENEGNYDNQSVCFIAAQNSHARHQWSIFVRGRESEGFSQVELKVSLGKRCVALLKWFLGSASRIVWGHGERPLRTFLTACTVIVVSALAYKFSGLVLTENVTRALNLREALYFSVVTYTTLGYGDFVPLGWTRAISMFECLSGIFLTPLFLIALTRRYLRIYH